MRQINKTVYGLALLLTCLIPIASVEAGSDMLVNPDPTDVYILQHRFANAPVPIDQIAALDPQVARADEFHRDAALKTAIEAVAQRVKRLDGVKRIQINMRSMLPEYDAGNQEYDLDIGNDSYIPIQTDWGRRLSIMFQNGNLAKTWTIPPNEAQKVLQRNGGRFIRIVLTLELSDSPAPVSESPAVLNTNIVEYDIEGSFNHVRLGHVTVK